MELKCGVNETKIFPLVAWDDIYRPKSQGGLGIRKNNNANKTSITKLGWRVLIDKDSIWVRIMRDKYVKNNNFFHDSKKKIETLLFGKILLIIENIMGLT